jgi:formate dehydrogenase maturation protein FdhE
MKMTNIRPVDDKIAVAALQLYVGVVGASCEKLQPEQQYEVKVRCQRCDAMFTRYYSSKDRSGTARVTLKFCDECVAGKRLK